MSLQLRPYQTVAVQAINDGIASGGNGILAVIPTGGGKTIVLADLVHQWMVNWPDTRVCVLAHTKELVEQNAMKFADFWQQQQEYPAPMGIYCAGLNQRNTIAPVLFASIQSVTKKAMQLGAFDVLLIDEAHHIPTNRDEGIWRRFIADATKANPNVRVVGLSATPYRLGSGSVVGKDHILKSICYEISVLELINQGYLCPLVTKSSENPMPDIPKLHIRNGEYVAAEVEKLMDQDSLIKGAVNEIMKYGSNRKSWLIFCAGVNHAAHVRDALINAGIQAGLVTGNTPRQERDQNIAAFKAGTLRALCNVNVLSEGFDFPGIDLVALLRPTKSPGLYYQQVGRSFRLSPGKQDALILDFAGVIAEHGPVDQIQVRKQEKAEEPGEAPQKDCPQCGAALHLSIMRCPECGYQFPSSPTHDAQAAEAAILSSQLRPIRHEVSSVRYSHHIGQSGIPTLRVDYYSGWNRIAQEWVCLEHHGYAKTKALQWITARYPNQFNHIPGNVKQLLDWIREGFVLRTPSAIHLRPGTKNAKYPEIVRYEWDDADLLSKTVPTKNFTTLEIMQ